MKGDYEVTIGIPVYNAEKYIRKTMESALSQSFQSIEFLVLDDCCTDSSIDIIRELVQYHPRGDDVVILRQPYNMGIGHARNRIVAQARGRYLLFLDSDDILPIDSVKLLYSAISKYNAQIVYGSNERIEEYDGIRKVTTSVYSFQVFNSNELLCDFAYRNYDVIPANVWKFLIDISVYRSNNLLFPITNYWEDYAVTMDLLTYVERAVFLPDITYIYFSRKGTLSNVQKRNFIYKIEIENIARAINSVKQHSERIKNKPYYNKRCCKLMKTELFIVLYILQNRELIHPSFSYVELQKMMIPPYTCKEVICSRMDSYMIYNLFFYFLGKIPTTFFSICVNILCRYKRMLSVH